MLAFLGSHLGDVEMEVADRIGFEFLLSGFVTLRLRQATDSMPRKAAMQG
jgi:hypothetical protein